MPARVVLVAGPAHSGKTLRVLDRYRETLRARQPWATLWLAPNRRAAAEVRGRLLGGESPLLAGCLTPGVMTFAGFAEAVVQFAPEPGRLIGRSMKRHLIRRLLEELREAGRLRHFGRIAHTSGLADLVSEWIGELKRLEVWPEEFRRACQARGMTDKDRELAEIYESYQQRLTRHNLYDAEGRFWSARTMLARGAGFQPTRGAGFQPATETSTVSKTSEVLKTSEVCPAPQAEAGWKPAPRLVVADGFTDFTRTQHEILEILAGRAEEMLITLPLDGEPGREDLFAKPLKTLDELNKRHPALTIERLPRPRQPAWPAMAHVERWLFSNPRKCPPMEHKARGIEVLAAPRELGEIELIAARIKQLLTQGCAESDGKPVRPGDVAVVFRSPAGPDPLVREVFGRLGIPVALESGRPLDRSKALAALAGLVTLDVEDWPFRALLSVLANSYFQPEWPEWQEGRAGACAQRQVRALQVPRGRSELIAGLRRLAEQPAQGPEDDDEPARPRRRADEAGLALALLERLGQAFDALPRRAALGGWAAAWERLARETGLLRAMGATSLSPGKSGVRVAREPPHPNPLPQAGEGTAALDALAWDQLREALRGADALSAWMGEPAPELDRAEALAELLDVLSSVQLREPRDDVGRVRVLSARSVRALRVPYLFLAGLSEKAFPPPDREDRLYNEPEAQRLIELGLPLVSRPERGREEMLLFYEAVTRASRRLWLSYPALDEAAQPLAPSPYLREIETACGPGMVPRTDDLGLSPVPHTDEPLCDADFRVKAVADALAGNVSLLAGLVRHATDHSEPVEEWGQAPGRTHDSRGKPVTARSQSPFFHKLSPLATHPLADNLLCALRLTAARSGRERFGPAEGMLQGEAVRAAIVARFGHERTLSATELERYASCPFRFLMESVLGIEPLEDLGLAVDYLQRGRLAHEALAVLHAEVNRVAGRPASPLKLDEPQYQRILDEALAGVLARAPQHPVQAALREVDRRLLRAWLADYRAQYEEYDGLWEGFDERPVPAYLEVSFGRPGGGGPPGPPGGGAEIDEPLVLSSPHGTVRLSGRIDRVDVGRAARRVVFNVLDYKTGGAGGFRIEDLRAGTALQLPVYALAVEELLLKDKGALPWRAGYWRLKDGGFQPKKALPMHRLEDGTITTAPEWVEIRSLTADVVALLAGALRRAEFPVYSPDEECTGYCPYSTVCRIQQVRSLEKAWQPAPSGF